MPRAQNPDAYRRQLSGLKQFQNRPEAVEERVDLAPKLRSFTVQVLVENIDLQPHLRLVPIVKDAKGNLFALAPLKPRK